MMRNENKVTQSEADAAPKWLQRTIIIAACEILLIAVFCQLLTHTEGPDKEWLLLATREWLAGKTLYQDIVETNPPLIIWLYTLPVFLNHYLHLSAHISILGAFGLVIVAGSLTLCWRILAFHPVFHTQERRVRCLLLLALAIVACVSTTFFADRDHLFFVLTLPFILRFLPSLESAVFPPRLRLLVAILGALGFCMKPHTMILWAAIMLTCYWRSRSFRILFIRENLVVYAAWIIYLAAIFICTPQYVTIVAPMLLATFYACNAREYALKFGAPPSFNLVLATLFFRTSRGTVLSKDILYLLTLVVALIAYTQINNSWIYSFQPFLCLTVILAGWLLQHFILLSDAGNKRQNLLTLLGKISCTIVLLANVGIVTSMDALALQQKCDGGPCDINRRLVETITPYHAHSFGTVTFGFFEWPLLVKTTGMEWQTRFHFLWMLNRFLSVSNPPQSMEIVHYVADRLADDINRHKPDLLFVDHLRSCDTTTTVKPVDLAQYLSAYAPFRKAIGHYRYQKSFDYRYISSAYIATNDQGPLKTYDTRDEQMRGHCMYDIYQRIAE